VKGQTANIDELKTGKMMCWPNTTWNTTRHEIILSLTKLEFLAMFEVTVCWNVYFFPAVMQENNSYVVSPNGLICYFYIIAFDWWWNLLLVMWHQQAATTVSTWHPALGCNRRRCVVWYILL